jgi:hypothetical protein
MVTRFQRSPTLRRPMSRQGRRQSVNTTAALATRSQATPSTSTRANSSTASDGPR